jgi:two-component system phosphate regulon sensor histidine kinase PhoR
VGVNGRRLAGRITFAYVLLIGAVAVALGAYLAVTLRAAQLDALQQRLAGEARLIAVMAGPAMRARDPQSATAQARAVAPTIGARVTLIGPDGVVLGDSEADPAAMENHAARPEVAAVLRGGDVVTASRHSASVDRDLLYVGVPIRLDEQTVGVARVAEELAGVESEVRRAVTTVLVALVALALVAALIAGYMARRISRPIARLTEAARAIAQGDLSRRVPVRADGGDEIGELGQAFDEMASRVRELVGSLSTDRGRLSAVLAAMADGVLLVDHDERVTLLNRAAEELLGITSFPGAAPRRAADPPSPGPAPSDGVGEPPDSGAPLPSPAVATDPPRLIELVPDHELYELARQALRRGSRLRDLVRFGPTGRHLHISATPMSTGVLLLIQDVTEIRRAETIRRDFAANVSHELKTPIASLKALVETLEDGALDDPPAARDFLGRMHVEVDDLAQLVQELLDLARIESGRARMTFDAHDVGELVASAANRLRPQAERASVHLSIVPDADLPAVRADAARIESALINLVHNAIKFTPPGGRVVVRAERAEAEGHPCVKVIVSDTGVGIAADDLSRLFERFYKADRSRASSGTGLGLAIVKHIVQAHGGQVGAESEVGAGSTFWFTLTLADAGAASPRAEVRL